MLSEDLVNERAVAFKELMALLLKYIDSTKDGIERAALSETLAKLICFSFDQSTHHEITELLKDATKKYKSNGSDPLQDL